MPAAIGYNPADYLTNRPATGSPALPVLGLVALFPGGMFLSGVVVAGLLVTGNL